MSHAMLKSGLAIALTAIVATGAMAQETKRGNGQGKGGGGSQQADSTKQGKGGGGSQQADSTKQGKGGGGSQQAGSTKPGKGGGGSQQAASTSSTGSIGQASASTSTSVATSIPSGTRTPFWWGGRNASATVGIDRTQSHQAAEIEAGKRRGFITGSEARSLNAEQDRIAEMERRAKADGAVTLDERRQIRSAQRDAERHISEETFDREREHARRNHRRYWGGWFGGRGWW